MDGKLNLDKCDFSAAFCKLPLIYKRHMRRNRFLLPTDAALSGMMPRAAVSLVETMIFPIFLQEEQ